MADKKKQRSVRDDIEKSLEDNAPLIGLYGGAVLGGGIAGKLASRSTKKWAKKNNWSKRDTDEIARGDARIMAVPGAFAGGTAGGTAGAGVYEASRKRRK